MRFTAAITLALFLLAAPALAGTKKYTYDAAGRLIKVDYGNNKGFIYRYDSNGNLLSRQPLSAEQPGRRRPARLSSEGGLQPNDSTSPSAEAKVPPGRVPVPSPPAP